MHALVAEAEPDDPLIAAAAAEAREDRRIGFWFYVMSDAVIFALLFVTYAVMVSRTAGGPAGRDLFDLSRAFAETVLLLASSFAFGMASVAARTDRGRGVVGWLVVTFVLGLAFLVMELSEFRGMVRLGAGPERSGFLSAFFALVGTHGLHVSAGLVWLVVMVGQLSLRGLTLSAQSRLERLGLFWHFLDIVWIGIFTFVYLAGVL